VLEVDRHPIPLRGLGAYGGGSAGGAKLYASAHTNRDGFFKMRVPKGRYLVTMVAGYQGEWEVDARSPQGARDIELRVMPTLRLRSPGELGVVMLFGNAPYLGGTLTAKLQGFPTGPQPG
jgi:hypothetical protein